VLLVERFWSLMHYTKGFTHSVNKIDYADFKGKVMLFLIKTQSIIKLSCSNSVICKDLDFAYLNLIQVT